MSAGAAQVKTGIELKGTKGVVGAENLVHPSSANQKMAMRGDAGGTGLDSIEDIAESRSITPRLLDDSLPKIADEEIRVFIKQYLNGMGTPLKRVTINPLVTTDWVDHQYHWGQLHDIEITVFKEALKILEKDSSVSVLVDVIGKSENKIEKAEEDKVKKAVIATEKDAEEKRKKEAIAKASEKKAKDSLAALRQQSSSAEREDFNIKQDIKKAEEDAKKAEEDAKKAAQAARTSEAEDNKNKKKEELKITAHQKVREAINILSNQAKVNSLIGEAIDGTCIRELQTMEDGPNSAAVTIECLRFTKNNQSTDHIIANMLVDLKALKEKASKYEVIKDKLKGNLQTISYSEMESVCELQKKIDELNKGLHNPTIRAVVDKVPLGKAELFRLFGNNQNATAGLKTEQDTSSLELLIKNDQDISATLELILKCDDETITEFINLIKNNPVYERRYYQNLVILAEKNGNSEKIREIMNSDKKDSGSNKKELKESIDKTMYKPKKNTLPYKGKEYIVADIHTVCLYKKDKNSFVLIDPTNSTYTQYLGQLLSKAFQITVDILHHNGEKFYYPKLILRIGREPSNARDCVDIAVKIGFKLMQLSEKPAGKRDDKKDEKASAKPSRN